MPAVADLVPAAGLGSVTVLLVGYLLRQMGADRTDYRERITAADARAEAERVRADAAQARIDVEIGKRREAEGQASVAAAELRALSATLSRELRRSADQPEVP